MLPTSILLSVCQRIFSFGGFSFYQFGHGITLWSPATSSTPDPFPPFPLPPNIAEVPDTNAAENATPFLEVDIDASSSSTQYQHRVDTAAQRASEAVVTGQTTLLVVDPKNGAATNNTNSTEPSTTTTSSTTTSTAAAGDYTFCADGDVRLDFSDVIKRETNEVTSQMKIWKNKAWHDICGEGWWHGGGIKPEGPR